MIPRITEKVLDFPINNFSLLDVELFQEAEKCIVKMVQLKYFNKELKQLKMKNKENVKISSKISSLNLYLDENGMIIAGGRLEEKIWHQQWLQASNTDGKGLPYLKICILWLILKQDILVDVWC